jgi:hypothetical protein
MKANNDSQGYIFGCKCRQPSLISQAVPLLSDCDMMVGCKNGQLAADWRDTSVIINDLKTLDCVNCSNLTIADHDKCGYPVCRPISYSESDKDPIYLNQTQIPLLKLTDPAIEPKFAAMFAYSESRNVPNPCSFDVFTGRVFDNDECRLLETRSTNIWYCSSFDTSVATIRFEDDYLKNNGGQWANGCYKFSSKSENSTIVEWFNKPPDASIEKKSNTKIISLPIVGTLTSAKYLTPAALKYLFLPLKEQIKSMVIVYFAPIPDDASELPYPLNNKNEYIHELGNKRFADGLPALSFNIFMLAFPFPVEEPFYTIESRQCSKIGKWEAFKWPETLFHEISYTYNPNAYSSMLSTSFFTCQYLDLLKDDNRFRTVPNKSMKTFTNTFIYYTDGIISPIWFGTDYELKLNERRLPNIWIN